MDEVAAKKRGEEAQGIFAPMLQSPLFQRVGKSDEMPQAGAAGELGKSRANL